MLDYPSVSTPRDSYSGIQTSFEQFLDLILIGIGDRAADHVDEYGNKLLYDGRAPLYSIKKIADDEGFLYPSEWIEAALSTMEHRQWTMHDTDKDDPNEDGFRVYLDPAGYERATLLVEKYYGASDQNVIPASDRLVTINHNSEAYLDLDHSLIRLINLVETSNSYREKDSIDQQQKLAELKALSELLKAPRVSPSKIQILAGAAFGFLIEQFAGAPIGELAQYVWGLVRGVLSF